MTQTSGRARQDGKQPQMGQVPVGQPHLQQAHSQFQLLKQRRFLPYFFVQALGAFNDNVFRHAIIGLIGVMVLAGTMSSQTRSLYT